MTSYTGVQGGNSRDADKFVVRLEDGMRERIAKIARAQHRSMNSYMIRALHVSLQIDEEDLGIAPKPESVGTRPVFVPETPVRFQGETDGVVEDKVGIVMSIYFREKVLTCDVVLDDGSTWSVDYDALKAY